MIEFTDFCEVWFLPESVAAIVGDPRYHTPRHRFKETLDVSLGYSRPIYSSFQTFPKLIWCGSWGCNLRQSLSNHGPHVFYRLKIRRTASRPGIQFTLVIDEEPLDKLCHVWLRFILLKYGCGQALKKSARVISNTAPYHNTRRRTSEAVYNTAIQHPLFKVSPDSNPIIVVLQTDAAEVSVKGGDVCGSASRGCTEVDAMDHVGPSFPPASSGHVSALQFFGFIQHDYRFPEG
ncbi:uncharacterized protein TNCV_4360611 [Trichonephila clavipes]|uniref:Uncharacterized protein n=1 Tax=Trichonephila clavipes TaxID=2585209 RepID=A0A8X6WB33_TRICX|nr:uncharacterized protein TNCV_4360611 [Trichonephila clavipes]